MEAFPQTLLIIQLQPLHFFVSSSIHCHPYLCPSDVLHTQGLHLSGEHFLHCPSPQSPHLIGLDFHHIPHQSLFSRIDQIAHKAQQKILRREGEICSKIQGIREKYGSWFLPLFHTRSMPCC
ncbi:uncharacterized protein [Gossypium hirsutum]|uniref:Uncharacterized protein n=1 Tax=Gossypium hirsutum TaxID=3635 RepID=A0ABM2ZTP8_GOSHI|nr:uncharacterized protein LOC121215374 [Gossypium hirsutum]